MKVGASLAKLLVFAVTTLVLTGVLVQTIGNLSFDPVRQYKAVFSDVTGLLAGTDVRIAGVKAGQVKQIKVYDQKLAEVTFTVNKEIQVPRSSRAEIRYLNLVGGRFLTLVEGPGTAMLPEDGTIPLAQTKPALDLTVLLNGFKPLFQALNPADVNRLAFEIVQTLQGEGATINDLLQRAASLTQTIADKDALVGSVINNLNLVLETVDQRDSQLDQLIVQMQRLFAGLSEDREAIGQSLDGIDLLTSDVAALLTDVRPVLKPDVDRLASLVNTLNDQRDELGQQIRDIPLRINAVTRTATYGSFFNFYLCKADGELTVGDSPLPSPTLQNGGVCTEDEGDD